MQNPFPDAESVRRAASRYFDKDEWAAMEGGKTLAEGGGGMDELVTVARWKSQRTLPLIGGNDAADMASRIRLATEHAYARRWEHALNELDQLKGVGLPMASAILCALLGGEFPIIDSRALCAVGHPHPDKGRNHLKHVLSYIDFCFAEARRLGVSVRKLDQALWQFDKERSKFAYVTLVTNADYAIGATALVRSLTLTGTHADIVVMHTGGVAADALAPLAGLGARLMPVHLLPTSDAFNQRHARAKIHADAPFTKGGKPAFHTPLDNFAKLRLWEMEEYERVVFIDADAIVLRNVDRLFGYPEFSAAPNVYEGLADFHRMNSGVFVARPWRATFSGMMEQLDAPDAFWPRTDQTFLQEFFPDWHGLPVFFNMLQYVWFNLPELWDWKSVSIVHYQYEKPWEAGHAKAEKLAPLVALWRAYYEGRGMPDVDALKNPEPR